MIQTATPETLYRRPVTRELALFVGEAVLLPGTLHDGHVSCELSELRLCAPSVNPSQKDVDVMVRPEQIRVLRAADMPSNCAAVHDAIVTNVVFQGQDAGVALQLQSGSRATVRARVPGGARTERSCTICAAR